MQDTYNQATAKTVSIKNGTLFGTIIALKIISTLYVFEDKRSYLRTPKNKVYFVDTLSGRTLFWDTAVLFASKYSHKIVQFNQND